MCHINDGIVLHETGRYKYVSEVVLSTGKLESSREDEIG